MGSEFIRRIARRFTGRAGANRDDTVLPDNTRLMSSSRILKLSAAYEPEVKRKLNIETESDIERLRAFPAVSMAIEKAVEDLVRSGEYSFDRMLIIMNPYQYAPLCALALFMTDESCSVSVKVRGKDETCDIGCSLEAGVCHRVPVLGLYAGRENTVEFDLYDTKGAHKAHKEVKLPAVTLSLKKFNPLITKEIHTAPFSYDLTLVYGGDDGFCPYAFDRNGDVRFFFGRIPKTYGFQPVSGGKFIFLDKKVNRLTFTNPASTRFYIVDQMGRYYKKYSVEKGAHHEFIELSNGDIATLSSAVDGGTYEDTMIELDKKTGAVKRELRMSDFVDDKFVDSSDWVHLNAIDYDEREKTVLLSSRNLHAVFKINYEKKRLEWIFGHPDFWADSSVSDKVLIPESDDMPWFFQAHAAYYIDPLSDKKPDERQIIMYDNHTHKRRHVSYFDRIKESYVRIYAINELKKTVRLVKSFTGERSTIRSNALLCAKTSSVLSMSGKLQYASDERKGLITEYDYDTGKIKNQFAVNHGYYRAYEFKFDHQAMSCAMPFDKDYAPGSVRDIKPCDPVDVSGAVPVPEPVLEVMDKDERARRERIEALFLKNPYAQIDPLQDIARIGLKIEEDILLVSMIDHLLLKIYLVGKEHTYERDFTDTRQLRPEYFARTGHTEAIPLYSLADDTYEIYYLHSQGLFRSGHYVTVKRVPPQYP